MARIKTLEHFRLPRWEDLPTIDLYLDQVLELLDSWLGDYISTDGKKIITKTMINNYVKEKYIPAPINKRYDRFALASLFVIAILKPVYTIEEISRLTKLGIRSREPGEVFDRFCSTIEEAVGHAYSHTSMPKPADPEDPRDIIWNVCNAFACQLYTRNVFLQRKKSQ